jgi:hypothetical protein
MILRNVGWISTGYTAPYSRRQKYRIVRAVLFYKRQSYTCNRPWWPIVLWDVEAPTLSMQSAHVVNFPWGAILLLWLHPGKLFLRSCWHVVTNTPTPPPPCFWSQFLFCTTRGALVPTHATFPWILFILQFFYFSLSASVDCQLFRDRWR